MESKIVKVGNIQQLGSYFDFTMIFSHIIALLVTAVKESIE